MKADDHPPVQPQSSLENPLRDLHLLRGSISLMPGVRINRNMIVLRHDGDLTLIGPVRMPPEGEAALEALGTVRHILRIGAAHGVDDAWAADRFGAELLFLEGTDTQHPPSARARSFRAGDALPCGPMQAVVFEGLVSPEIALVWPRHGGVLLTSDALQHYGDWRHFNLRGLLLSRLLGFRRDTVVGPVWHRLLTVDEAALRQSFDTLLAHDFRHAVSLHGTFVRDSAHADVARAVEREFTKAAMPDWAYRRLRARRASAG